MSSPQSPAAAFMTTSWDDGHELDLRIADLLVKYNLTATFYIPRHTSRGVMPDDQIRQLSTTFEIGAHTINHHRLTQIPPEKSQEEITASKAWIENLTGKPCPLFCPPGGQFNSLHLDQITRAGFSAIRTTELMSLDYPRSHRNLQIMPTTLQSRPQPTADCLRNFIKRRTPSNAILYFRHAFARNWVTAARNLLNHTCTHGGVFHLWGHSWEIDQFHQWSQLEEILRAMSDRRAHLACLTNGDLCLPSRRSPPAPVPTC